MSAGAQPGRDGAGRPLREPSPELPDAGQLERELAYYRRECNAMGARLLRLQEEQSNAFREARRSRTVAKLIREAYRLADQVASPDELGGPMLAVLLDNTMCDRAALLREEAPGSGRFVVTHALGMAEGPPPPVGVAPVPAFFFTTSRTPLEAPAYELTGILRLPYVLWAYDAASGAALIVGNLSESNVSRPFEDGDQELVEGALSVYIDVLLRKRAEVELRAAKLVAEEASSARSRFLATLTHELRTPLNAIIGFSEMMATGSRHAPSAGERAAYNDHILGSARHLLRLINEILDYSALSRGRVPLAPRWVPLHELVAESLGAAAAAAAARDVVLPPAPPGPAVLLWVDRTRFRQILDNLLSNAIRFTPAGGWVRVGTTWPGPGGMLLIEVQDSGVGMAVDDVPRALEPFQQVESPFSRGSPGTGLGLPIAKGLVEAHEGSLSIRSAPGQGTTVTVTLPASRLRAGPDRGAVPDGG